MVAFQFQTRFHSATFVQAVQEYNRKLRSTSISKEISTFKLDNVFMIK
jgi:hypothetical protein